MFQIGHAIWETLPRVDVTPHQCPTCLSPGRIKGSRKETKGTTESSSLVEFALEFAALISPPMAPLKEPLPFHALWASDLRLCSWQRQAASVMMGLGGVFKGKKIWELLFAVAVQKLTAAPWP